VIAVIFMMSIVPLSGNESVTADTIDTFSTGNSEETYTFTSGGLLDTIYLKVPVDGTVISATFDVTGQVNTGLEYPTVVRSFVGTLSNQVYQFAGPAYGSMGYQSLFSDGATKKTVVRRSSSTMQAPMTP
jgi:hypothetical protein